jgi:gas vesicle protein
MQRTFSFIAGALCGAAFGAVTALLLAPMSGREIQEQGRLRAEQVAEEVRRAYEDKRAELKAQLEALKSQRTINNSGA